MNEQITQQTHKTNGFTFSPRLVLGIAILAALFDVISCFLPWGIITTSGNTVYVYLPWTPILNFGQETLVFSEPFIFFLLAIIERAVVVLTWISIIIYEFFEKRQLIAYMFILVSGIFSFLAFILFTQTGTELWIGAYIVLFSAVLKIFNVLAKALKIEFVIEHKE